ncbi:hypothetical protein NW759_016986 [Fusarium solani]|nr:hypothetical protein NW759_016986 [Fusarium solani]
MAPTASSTMPLDLSKYEKLDKLQLGHIRHFHNLVTQLDGEWRHMGGQETQQEFVDAFRYQLAQMAYAVSVAHYHRLPAARSVFKPLLRRLISKMLHPQVWHYWYLTSQSGAFTDPGRTELRKPWADPIIKENIMYSGHLLLMTSLYAMLFDDDEFEKPGSLSFTWTPLFWGLGPETFHYDNRSLQRVILRQMEENGWVGVCCEPNNVFVVCNQFPLIAIRLNDARDGLNQIEEVLPKYKAAIIKRGMIQPDGTYVDWLYLKQGYTQPAQTIGSVAWSNAFMNAWNPEYVRSHYDRQALGFITTIDGQVRMQSPMVGFEYRRIAQAEGVTGDNPEILAKAKAEVAKMPPIPFPYTSPVLGYVVLWLSELGKRQELQGLLQYVDERMNPTWENGGLFYPRNDTPTDESGDWTHMDPFTGNAAIGYARLNVEDGQKLMWERPWSREFLAG